MAESMRIAKGIDDANISFYRHHSCCYESFPLKMPLTFAYILKLLDTNRSRDIEQTLALSKTMEVQYLSS